MISWPWLYNALFISNAQMLYLQNSAFIYYVSMCSTRFVLLRWLAQIMQFITILKACSEYLQKSMLLLCWIMHVLGWEQKFCWCYVNSHKCLKWYSCNSQDNYPVSLRFLLLPATWFYNIYGLTSGVIHANWFIMA